MQLGRAQHEGSLTRQTWSSTECKLRLPSLEVLRDECSAEREPANRELVSLSPDQLMPALPAHWARPHLHTPMLHSLFATMVLKSGGTVPAEKSRLVFTQTGTQTAAPAWSGALTRQPLCLATPCQQACADRSRSPAQSQAWQHTLNDDDRERHWRVQHGSRQHSALDDHRERPWGVQ